ncbi:MAG: ABC transporter permease [Thermoplasmata archaeon]
MKLYKFIIGRAIQVFVTLLIILTMLFLIFRAMPGDAADMVINPQMKPEAKEKLRSDLGLDEPLHVQYGLYMKNMLTFNLGRSFRTQNPVWLDISPRLQPTLMLFGSSLILSYLIGILIGMGMAWYRGSTFEITAIIGSLVFRSMPYFWFGILMLFIFSSQLDIFPVGGMKTPGVEMPLHERIVDVLYHMALPLITLVIVSLGGIALLMRSTMLDTLGEDYIITARAKGLPERKIMIHHAARNAMLPILTSVAISIAFIFAGGVITEQVFSWPGLGRLLIERTLSHDYPVVQGAFYIIAILVLVANAVADVMYAYLDPRVQL